MAREKISRGVGGEGHGHFFPPKSVTAAIKTEAERNPKEDVCVSVWLECAVCEQTRVNFHNTRLNNEPFPISER